MEEGPHPLRMGPFVESLATRATPWAAREAPEVRGVQEAPEVPGAREVPPMAPGACKTEGGGV